MLAITPDAIYMTALAFLIASPAYLFGRWAGRRIGRALGL